MAAGPRAKPVVIVTGATGGVGFSICHRLLLQLLSTHPPDALPQPRVAKPGLQSGTEGNAYEGLTLILACRNTKKADSARQDLLRLLDDEVRRRRLRNENVRQAELFMQNVEVVVEMLDLADLKSVFKFAANVVSRHPYISHLVCNAGVVSLRGYDWPLCIKQMITSPIAAVTAPLYKLQVTGEKSVDDIGWVFQCNVFGHYALFKQLEPFLRRYETVANEPARVLWMSSLGAVPDCYNPNDWQLLDNDLSYEASKYQMDLIVGTLEARTQAQVDFTVPNGSPPIRHILVHPGVVMTNIASSSLNNWFLETLAQLTFYIVRFLGSQNHLIYTFKAAISAVHLILVPLAFIKLAMKEDGEYSPFKFASKTTRFGREYVDMDIVPEWKERRLDGEDLVKKCDDLYQKHVGKDGIIH